MPTDNSIISQTSYNYGDVSNRFISLIKDTSFYGLHEIKGGNHIFWKRTQDLKTMIYTQSSQEAEVKDIKSVEI